PSRPIAHVSAYALMVDRLWSADLQALPSLVLPAPLLARFWAHVSDLEARAQKRAAARTSALQELASLRTTEGVLAGDALGAPDAVASARKRKLACRDEVLPTPETPVGGPAEDAVEADGRETQALWRIVQNLRQLVRS
ncbi:hypothetical protein H632_c2366p0, partial [Helicosporidium sp. ATCC 50920]